MPKIAELKCDDKGDLWCRVPIQGPQGEITIWTRQEIENYKLQIIRSVLDKINETEFS